MKSAKTFLHWFIRLMAWRAQRLEQQRENSRDNFLGSGSESSVRCVPMCVLVCQLQWSETTPLCGGSLTMEGAWTPGRLAESLTGKWVMIPSFVWSPASFTHSVPYWLLVVHCLAIDWFSFSILNSKTKLPDTYQRYPNRVQVGLLDQFEFHRRMSREQ